MAVGSGLFLLVSELILNSLRRRPGLRASSPPTEPPPTTIYTYMQTFYRWLAEVNRQPEDILSRSVPTEDGVIGKFRRLVLDELGDLAVLVLDVRLAGGSAMSLVGSPIVGSGGRQEVERLCMASGGSPGSV